MELSRAEQAVVRAVLERGYLNQEQLDEALRLPDPPGALAKLAERLTVVQVNALRVVYEAASDPGNALQATLPPTAPGLEARRPAEPPPRAAAPTAEEATLTPESLEVQAQPLRQSAHPSSLSPGEVLGSYRIVREIARGGMGIVFLAEHTQLGRQVALKLLLEGDSKRVQRFLTEAQAAAKLRHPGVVAVHDVGSVGRHHYMVMDLITGAAADDLVDRDGPLDPARAARIAAEVAEALQHAHEHGVLHRDVKPSNVMIDADDRALLTDFGLARDADVSRASLTKTGEIMGTPAFMPPEQAAGDAKRADARADVYSLGATLYYLLCGRPPFQAQSLALLLARIHRAEADPPSTFRSQIPEALDRVCLQSLTKDPADRYASAGELAADLRRFLEGGSVAARAPRRRRSSLGVLLAGVVLVGAGALAGVALTRSPPTPSPPPPTSPVVSTSTPEPVVEDLRPPAPSNTPPRLERARGRLVEDDEWTLGFGLTPAQLEKEWPAQWRQGKYVCSLHANPDASSPELTVVWRRHSKGTGPYQEVRFHDTLEEAQGALRVFAQRGLRLHCSAVYREGASARRIHSYVNDGARARVHFDKTVEELNEIGTRYWKEGWSPVWYTTVPDGSGRSVRSDVIWRSVQARHYSLYGNRPRMNREVRVDRGYLRSFARLDDPLRPIFHVLFIDASIHDPLVFYRSRQLDDLASWRAMTRAGHLPHSAFVLGTGEERRVTTCWVRYKNRVVDVATGEEWPELDGPLLAALRKLGVHEAAVAVTRGPRLVHVRSFSRLPGAVPATQPHSRFRLGTLSMVLTSAAALRAVQEGELDLDARLDALLPQLAKRMQAGGERRAGGMTLEHLLALRSGWTRSLDVLYPTRNAKQGDLDIMIAGAALGGKKLPATPEELLDVLVELPLNHGPGATRATDSELGHQLLGRVLARLGHGYEAVVRRELLRPLDVRTFALGRTHVSGRLENEVLYDGVARVDDVTGRGGIVPAQYGGFNLEVLGPSRGWIASAPDVARFVSAFAEPGAFFDPPTYERMVASGLVWNVEGDPADPRLWWTARMPGTFVHAERLPGGTGLVLLLNQEVDAEGLVDQLRAHLQATTEWPEHDLFERY